VTIYETKQPASYKIARQTKSAFLTAKPITGQCTLPSAIRGRPRRRKRRPQSAVQSLLFSLAPTATMTTKKKTKKTTTWPTQGSLHSLPCSTRLIPDAPAPINKKRIMSKTEQELDPASKSVLEQYRAKYPNPAEGYHRNYGMDYPY
jgi:hypothetical protein